MIGVSLHKKTNHQVESFPLHRGQRWVQRGQVCITTWSGSHLVPKGWSEDQIRAFSPESETCLFEQLFELNPNIPISKAVVSIVVNFAPFVDRFRNLYKINFMWGEMLSKVRTFSRQIFLFVVINRAVEINSKTTPIEAVSTNGAL